MSEPTNSPPAAIPRWVGAVLIPPTWTPEQALAVFELLDDLRAKLWDLYGCQIQDILQQEQGAAPSIPLSPDPDSDNAPF